MNKSLEELIRDGNYMERSDIEQLMMESVQQMVPIEQLLKDKGLMDEKQIAHIMASELNIPYLSLKDYKLSKELIDQVPAHVIYQYKFIPIDLIGSVLTLIFYRIPPTMMVQELQGAIKCEHIFPFVGTMTEIEKAITEHIDTTEAAESPERSQELSRLDNTNIWESIFDEADQDIMSGLREKADYLQDGSGGSAASEVEDALANVFGADEEVSSQEEEIASGDDSPEQQLALLEAQLEENPTDYDIVNQYVEVALSIDHLEAAVTQLALFAQGLDRMGDGEGAVNCYEYILELDPDNVEAQGYIDGYNA